MHKFVSVIISFAFFLSISCQDQEHPLCGRTGPSLWVNDPANCHAYLFCRFDDDDPTTLLSVHQLDCRTQGSNHYLQTSETEGECIDELDGCDGTVDFFCPIATPNNLMIANSTDPTCRQYRPCQLPGFPMISCRESLVFNRNTGGCDLPSVAPCSPPVLTPQCPPGETGFFPGTTCWTYVFCFNGDFRGYFECPRGYFFDQNTQDCEPDTNNVCPRMLSEFVAPRVPTVSGKRYKLENGVRTEIKGL